MVVIPHRNGKFHVIISKNRHHTFPAFNGRMIHNISRKHSQVRLFGLKHMPDHFSSFFAFFHLFVPPVDIGKLCNFKLFVFVEF